MVVGTAEADLPSAGLSLLRVMGALLFVLGLFFAGVWGVRNWRRMIPTGAAAPDLRVLEVKSLGVRQSLVVVGYRKQRMLLSAAPTGVTLLTHLPEADEADEAEAVAAGPSRVARPDFMVALREVLGRRS